MSSEQVIAKLDAVAGEGCKVSLETHTRTPDRLSTPAAGGDDLAALLDTRAGAHGGDKLLTEAAAMIRQLQARNAEQAAEIAELCRYARLQNLRASKLTALLDGIEGLEKECAEAAEHETGMLGAVLQSQSEQVKALREKAKCSD